MGVMVKENGNVIGMLDDGGSLDLIKGIYIFIFEKSGYWSVMKMIDVQGDMIVSVEMYFDSVVFKFENFLFDISIFENMIYMFIFIFLLISIDVVYNIYLSLSGFFNVFEVQKDGQVVFFELGKYYFGDILGLIQIFIKFKVGVVGQYGFILSFESYDVIMSKIYMMIKSVIYIVELFLFLVQMFFEWQVGQNEFCILESSGQSYFIMVVLKDSQGNEVWSDFYVFSFYEVYFFSVNVLSEGQYMFEFQWNGQVVIYDVIVNFVIMFIMKQLIVEKGGEGMIVFYFKNLLSDVQYYMIKVLGGFLLSEINQSILVGLFIEKDVSIVFVVLEDLIYDVYEFQVQVFQGNVMVFQDKVVVSIGDFGGFMFFGGLSGNIWFWFGVGGFGFFVLVGFVRRR